jgi:nitrite reductase/ring-hydroxylating ferredoxin subunit/DMSO/TMAO reductase YedYZ heme-binding membrane subunit
MSAGYKPVGWNRSKLVYDAALLLGIAAYLLIYLHLGPSLARVTSPPDGPTMAMKAYGSCAFLMLSFVLCIGPLARLDSRFLPLLYNRRHFGVLTCAVAGGHVAAVLGWYFSYSATPVLAGLLGADTSYGQLHGFPFVSFGIAAFLILLALAATSHDFWLAFLTPPTWKALHRLIYAAYALVAIHLALGQLQDARNPFFPVIAFAALVTVSGLHLAAALRTRQEDSILARLLPDGWVDAGAPQAIAEGRAITVTLDGGDKVAIFRNDGNLSAVSNACAHQNGPLGEGRVIDGCVTCPWHGYQYRLEDGCAPPPFTERLATYNLRLDDGHVLLDPRPNAPGTPIEPLRVSLPAPVATT